MGTNNVVVRVVDSVAAAPHYARDTVDVRAADLEEVVIVKGGTQGGNPTVDLVFRTDDGAQFVAMITGRILEGIAAVVRGVSGP